MRAPLYQLDAFATGRFGGNPAAVMVLDAWPDAQVMQVLAAENNLSETAFLVRQGEEYEIRWFTPALEVPLCGHATLASAAVVMERLQPERSEMVFHSASGPLRVRRYGDGYAMDLPRRRLSQIEVPAGFAAAISAEPSEVLWDGGNFVARLQDAVAVRVLEPDFAAIRALPCGGVIVTAEGDGEYDCVSRYFAPAKGVDEDPVTGAAHCGLAPYWCERLDKREILAWQASRRGGVLRCRPAGDRVEIAGTCVFYLEGEASW